MAIYSVTSKIIIILKDAFKYWGKGYTIMLITSNFPNDKIENKFTHSLFRETPVNWLILLLRFDPTE